MKNMKVSMKLITGFLVSILMAVAVGITGIIGFNRMSKEAEAMYSDMAVPLSNLSLATEYFQRIRVQSRNAIIYTGDAQRMQTVDTELNNYLKGFEDEMAAYKSSLNTPDGTKLFQDVMDQYNRVMKPGVSNVLNNAKAGMPSGQLLEMMSKVSSAADAIALNLRQLNTVRLGSMSEANTHAKRLSEILPVVILAAIAISVSISLSLAIYISGLISKPLAPLTHFLKQAGSTGEISLPEEELRKLDGYALLKDEIGQTIAATQSFVVRITQVSRALESIAGGDLTVELTPLSHKDVLGMSLHKVTESLNSIFGEINTATGQVSTGASQVADGAQMLATGATQQAASIQELSSSVSDIATRTKENAAKAGQAAKLAGSIKDSAEKGNQQMEGMMSAVRDISQSSNDIGKVIKVIDDIAFQTNILALNAAVEAARAGQHGKGFAVVADEVRNLAAKSAEAAKDTESLITSSIEKAEMGVQIAMETSASLNEIVYGINESNTIVAEIAASSEEQSLAISQINIGIDQVAKVVQQNSATAEESAAASEEMSSQSSLLKQLVAQYRIRGMCR